MVYIARDGTIHNREPWSIQRLINIFWGFVAFIVMFFKTLFDPISKGLEAGRSGSGGNNRRGPPPGPPGNRRIGRINTLPSCDIPGGG